MINKKAMVMASIALTMMLSSCTVNTQRNISDDTLQNTLQAAAGNTQQDAKDIASPDNMGTKDGMDYVGYLNYGEHLNSSDEEKFVFPSFLKFEEQYLEYWQGIYKNVSFLENRYVLLGYDEEHGWSKDFDVYMRYYAFDDKWLPVMYETTLHCIVDDEMRVYVAGVEHTKGDSVTTAQQGDKLGIFSMVYNHTEFIPYQDENQSLSEYLAAGKGIDELLEPALALVRIAHVEGGKVTELTPVVDNEIMCLTYTFADGSHLNYNMHKIDGYWFISSLIGDEYADIHKRTAQYINGATTKRLRAVTKTMYTCTGDDKYYELSDNFLLLGEDKKTDSALYGLFGQGAMILCVGDNAYPIFRYWSSRSDMQFTANDYDNDGAVEYIYSTCEGTGTGVYFERIYVLEINADNTLTVNSMKNINTQLKSRISYRYDEQAQALYWIIDGKETGGPQDISKAEFNELKNVDLVSIQYIKEQDGHRYLEIHPGLICDSNVSSDFRHDLCLTIEILYSPDGTFTLDNISVGKILKD